MRRPSDVHVAQNGAEDHGDARLAHGFLDPAAEQDFVVIDDRRHRPVPAINRLRNFSEIAQEIFGHAVGKLVTVVPLANRPQNVPMIELTIWPPSVGRPSISATRRPSLAASSAAEIPAEPAPTTQISTLTS